jgi:hypothetical protein
MPQHAFSAITDGNHLKKWIFKTEDTVADRAHTTFKAIEVFMTQYYMPEGGPYARSLEHFARRFIVLEDILQKAKAWHELAERRAEDIGYHEEEFDSDSQNYLGLQLQPIK